MFAQDDADKVDAELLVHEVVGVLAGSGESWLFVFPSKD